MRPGAEDRREGVLNQAYQWVDERVGLTELLMALFKRLIPKGVGLWYTIGFASVLVLINQFVTGALLAMYYAPTPDHAYDSILYISNEVTLGSVIRGLHHWGASAMVVLAVLHGLVVFALGAYKYPRELTWVVGVFLFLLVLGSSFIFRQLQAAFPARSGSSVRASRSIPKELARAQALY